MDLNKRQRIFDLIDAERLRQHEKWGDQSHKPDGTWALILGEEVGEWMKALLDGDLEHAKEEMTQVLAVGTAWLEARMQDEEAQDPEATDMLGPESLRRFGDQVEQLLKEVRLHLSNKWSHRASIFANSAKGLARYVKSLAAWEKKK